MAMKPRTRRGRANHQQGWAGPRHSQSTDARRRAHRPRETAQQHERPIRENDPEVQLLTLDLVLDEFTASWDRGERPTVEGYLERLRPEDSAELIYQEYCLAEQSDLDPNPADYLARFPD